MQLPGADPEHEVPEVVAYGRGVIAEMIERFPDIDIHLTGVVMLNNAFPEATQHDLRTLVSLMFVVVIITLGLLVRRLTETIATVLVVSFSMATAMGLAGWLGMRLTGSSAAAPTIILTLAVADCVHFLTNFVQGMRGGLDKRAAHDRELAV